MQPQTTKSNVINPRVHVRIMDVMSDASGAPAVLQYDGLIYRFDMLGELKRELLGGTGTRVASRIALEVCTHAYVTLLETRVDAAWREANARMYDDAPATVSMTAR
jgi:hypothetical protein